jgi:hypothetical protein
MLTDKGAKLYKSTIPLFEKCVGEIFAGLSKGDQKASVSFAKAARSRTRCRMTRSR